MKRYLYGQSSHLWQLQLLSNCLTKWQNCQAQFWAFKNSSHVVSKWPLVSKSVHTQTHTSFPLLSLPHLVCMSYFFMDIPPLTPLAYLTHKHESHLPQYIFSFIFPCWARKSCSHLQLLLGELLLQEHNWEDLACPNCRTPGSVDLDCSRHERDNIVCWC